MVSLTRAETKVVVLFYKVYTIFTRTNTVGRLSDKIGLEFLVNERLLRDLENS
jgi:hypothetical protein